MNTFFTIVSMITISTLIYKSVEGLVEYARYIWYINKKK